jgi:hypothetical protein
MIQINLLEDTDVIQENDYVRQLQLFYNGQSDYVQTTSSYGGRPINRLGWIKAKYFCPHWVGEKVKDFVDGVSKFYNVEFIRGDISKEHIEPLKKEEIKLLEYSWKLAKNNKP